MAGVEQQAANWLQRADQFVKDNIYGVRTVVLFAEAGVGAVAAPSFGVSPEVGAVIGGNVAILGLAVDVRLRRALRKPVGWETVEPNPGSDGKDA